jgi:hypothetical protein
LILNLAKYNNYSDTREEYYDSVCLQLKIYCELSRVEKFSSGYTAYNPKLNIKLQLKYTIHN